MLKKFLFVICLLLIISIQAENGFAASADEFFDKGPPNIVETVKATKSLSGNMNLTAINTDSILGESINTEKFVITNNEGTLVITTESGAQEVITIMNIDPGQLDAGNMIIVKNEDTVSEGLVPEETFNSFTNKTALQENYGKLLSICYRSYETPPAWKNTNGDNSVDAK